MGRWAGLLIFLWTFQLLGVVAGLAVTRIFDVRFVPTLWFGFANMFVGATLLSGVSLGLSAFMPPLPAGFCAFLLQIAPSLAKDFLHDPKWLVRAPAFAAYYLAPAALPVNLISDSFSRELIHPEYGLYSQVLCENLLYAAAVFALGCVVFGRREPRLR
jgi:hypothetical protein